MMNYLLLVGDVIGDYPVTELNGKPPLKTAASYTGRAPLEAAAMCIRNAEHTVNKKRVVAGENHRLGGAVS